MASAERAERDYGFRFMALMLRIRDLVSNPRRTLDRARLREGMSVVDYGCGPGSFTIPAAQLVEEAGRIFAVDIHPLAIQTVEDKASRKGLENVRTILMEGYDTGIEASSIDRVLLLDTLHLIEDRDSLFREIHRMLKPEGLLFMGKGHIAMSEQRNILEKTGLFKVVESQGSTMLAAPQS